MTSEIVKSPRGPDVVSLVGDVGATNARFGLVSSTGDILHPQTYAAADFAEIGDALEAYLAERGGLPRPRDGALAIAAVVSGDVISMTNHPWKFSIAALRQRLGLERLIAINDFTAVALAVPRLRPDDRMAVGGGFPIAARPVAVLGPGSGLGVSGLIAAGDGWIALAGEGGHVTMAPADERENAVLAVLRRHFDHVSAERCLSGPGLVNLYGALCEIDGVQGAFDNAAQITDAGVANADQRCREATEMFCAMLGTVAGNLALTLGAQGGVYIAGGIVPRLGERFAASGFRARFEAKGRLRAYVAAIPTWVITHKLPAFLGCTAALAAPGIGGG